MDTGGDPKTVLATERTNFAKLRTSLALDRTTLAWIRTALTFATFGFGMIGFFRAIEQSTHTAEAAHLHQAAIRMGAGLVLIGMIATLLAATSHFRALRKLTRGEPLPLAKWPLTVAIAVLISVLGLYALWAYFIQ